jgi:hypothetical protein
VSFQLRGQLAFSKIWRLFGTSSPDRILRKTIPFDAIKRRDHGKETLAAIGHSYNVSGWTIARLEA